ncbi:hypothetical protein [Nocardioides jishulii]|uniref:Uncharacterized protein n=1 Tax=Nocardioides jishulii TaxID=2575440 RepID=A0A4U2YMX7_9ACTN|nr:hypothetical protein [Nocardioides jishulii]QCX27513.1 hypothetical protein FCL41_08245 [Nocardioides jishulii]TKI62320.1 hypothetical protein FC770_07910 [Nocardioides jishulii]
MSAHLPVSAVLAWWGTSWLRGLASTDEVLDALSRRVPVHSVRSHGPEVPELDAASLVPLLALWRSRGATSASLALPVEGHPLGIGGPRDLTVAATDVGEAVIVTEVGLAVVPDEVGAGVTWTLHEARRRQVPDVGEADRGLRASLLATLDALEHLDVASWSPDAADRAMNLRHLPDVEAVPGVPESMRALAARGIQAWWIVDAALADHGGAVSAVEVARRAEALKDLGRAARTALVAACSPETWPPEGTDR